MLLCFFLLFFFCESTVKSFSITTWPTIEYTSPEGITSAHLQTSLTTEGKLSPVELVATPHYPVAAGQRVNLHCTAFTEPHSITWCWERLENQTWQDVESNKKDLILTKPEHSGIYRCCAASKSSPKTVSSSHTVYIISVNATVGENLGIAAFVLSLLSLMAIIAILFWLGRQRFGDTLTIANTSPKGFPGPEKSPKGGLPKSDSDGDVYMNYTGTNHAYSDLDPNNMTGDNVYSSLS